MFNIACSVRSIEFLLSALFFYLVGDMGKLINVLRDRYSIIPNEVFMDRRLDFRAKGILCTIFSLPNGWEFSVKGLVELVTQRDDQGNELSGRGEGKAAVDSAIRHLEALGYLERIPTKDRRGHFTGYDYKLNIPPIEPK